ncbi:MAG: glycosyltransferase family 1 protein [Alphaproteobacteria bacterium]|nr:glycosyltransferase family 1 protein [Alphaproteobacteria bacterium]
MRVPVWIVSPPGYPHSQAFDDIGRALAGALHDLGHQTCVLRQPPESADRVLTLGANLLPFTACPADLPLVLFNLEQVAPGSMWFSDAYQQVLRRFPVLDYSRRNIEILGQLGIAALHCDLGYHAELENAPPAEALDIDVLFYGSVNERRLRVLRVLRDRGVNIVAVFNCYGAERNALIARSRIVLNLHFYDGKIFEIVRVSHLLANRACVVAETGLDAELEAPYRAGVAFATYEGLVDTCADLLRDEMARRRLATAGYQAITARPQAASLERALATLTSRPSS